MRRVLHVLGVRWWSALAAYAVDLASSQRERGDRVRVAVLRDSPAAIELDRWGRDARLDFDAGLAGQIGLFRAMRRALGDAPDTVIHVHTGLGHLAAELARRAGPGAVLVRTRGDIRSPRTTPGNMWLYRRSDAVVLSGDFARDSVARLGVPDDRIAVVHGGVNTDHFQPGRLPPRGAARRELGLPDPAFLIGIVARLSPVKGHRHAIATLADLVDLDPPVHLVASGEPAQLSASDLLEDAATHGVRDRVHVLPRQTDVRTVLGALDVGVVASVGSEAICRIAAEMMACGLPVVASAVSVLPEMIADGETGLLVAPAMPPALAAAVRRLHADPPLRARLGRRGREVVEESLALSRVRERYDAIYDAARRRGGGEA